MQFVIIKIIFVIVAVLGVVQFTHAFAGGGGETAGGAEIEDLRAPDLPAACRNIEAPAGHKVSFRVDAVGVQVYRWNGSAWDFVAPVANLYASENYRGEVGFHYAGPTWESNGGSKVVARRVAGCSPDSNAIAWLLLQTTATDGAGIFGDVTYVQRVNTVGGLAPTTPGEFVGREARVPYTTEYYFYRARRNDRNSNDY
jgi:hypothetical protein